MAEFFISVSAETHRRLKLIAKRRDVAMGKFVDSITTVEQLEAVCLDEGCCDCEAERSGI